jgi:hypothetical protein
LPKPGLHNVAEDGFVNLFRVQTGAADRFGYGLSSEING